MRYWPLIQSALLRRPIELVLILCAVTVGFALFGFMIALSESEHRVLEATRPDRFYVNSRFETPYGLPISLEEQLRTIDGITGVGAFRWVEGRFNGSREEGGVITVDEGMRIAMGDYPISNSQWTLLFSSGTGTLITKKAAAHFGLHKGDVFHLSRAAVAPVAADKREDGSSGWSFEVLDVLPDIPFWGEGGIMIGNYRNAELARSEESRGYVNGFFMAVADPAKLLSITRRIDTRYANSGTATISTPARAAQEAMIRTSVSMASMTWGVGTAGFFMIVFLTGNAIAQSVRRRLPEFATLKAMGYTDARVMGLVFLEAAIPCCLGAVVGTGLSVVFAALPRQSLPLGLASVPHASVTLGTLEWAVACAVLIALAGSMFPIATLRRLDVATAIAGRRQ